mmetsp:Transcript_5864/g.11179  ORF Transcript_5864/g.11179 Transcript_5864/m.11179 type:complete len:208 (-) Transcript_5864:761-1384(-)
MEMQQLDVALPHSNSTDTHIHFNKPEAMVSEVRVPGLPFGVSATHVCVCRPRRAEIIRVDAARVRILQPWQACVLHDLSVPHYYLCASLALYPFQPHYTCQVLSKVDHIQVGLAFHRADRDRLDCPLHHDRRRGPGNHLPSWSLAAGKHRSFAPLDAKARRRPPSLLQRNPAVVGLSVVHRVVCGGPCRRSPQAVPSVCHNSLCANV